MPVMSTRMASTVRPGLPWAIAIAAMIAGTRVAGAQAVSPFVMHSSNGANVLQFGVLAQADGHVTPDEIGDSNVDPFVLRRLRPNLQGRVLRRFEFFFNPDFGKGTFVVQDAYVDTVFAKALRLRAGKFKTPVGLERLAPASALVLAERSLVTPLLPNREVGVQVLGDIQGGTFSYMAALTNGPGAGTSSNADTHGSREVSLRVMARPFAVRPASPLCGLAVGIAGSAAADAD